jgi:hypothetical protein
MQERMLSSRIVHFTREGLIWECRQRYVSLQMISSCDETAFYRTIAGVPRILEEGQPREAWGIRIPAIELADGDISEEHLTLLHTASEANYDRAWISDNDSAELTRGEQRELVSWWYKNVVLPYSTRQMTLLTDRLPAIAGMACLFAEHIQSPYISGLWLAEIEEGLEWRRAGDTFQDRKLEYFPSFSWTSHPGPVSWPAFFHVRPYGRSFIVLDELFSQFDPYGKIISANTTLSGHLRLVTLITPVTSRERIAMSYQIKRKLLGEANIAIGDVELDFEERDDERPMYCYLL